MLPFIAKKSSHVLTLGVKRVNSFLSVCENATSFRVI